MKSAHLQKVQARAARVKQLLLPDSVPRGDIADPEQRLRELVLRVGGRDALGPDFPLRGAVADLVRFLGTDVPELIQAVRDAQEETRKARAELADRAGTAYSVTITSDAPLAVSRQVTTLPMTDVIEVSSPEVPEIDPRAREVYAETREAQENATLQRQ